MDPVTVTFYALVCGCLSILAPSFGGYIPRLAIGVAVGIAAASSLPVLRASLGL